MTVTVFRTRAAILISCSILVLLSLFSLADARMQSPLPVTDELTGHQWIIGSYFDGSQTWSRGPRDSLFYISFKNGEIEGNLGCGQLSGRYTLSGDHIDVMGKWDADRVSCSPSLEKQAEAMLKALNGRRELRASGLTSTNTSFLALYDQSQKFQISLIAHKPGDDLLEFDSTFWRVVAGPQDRGGNLSVSVHKVIESFESFVIQGRRLRFGGAADVDSRKPQTLRPEPIALSKRSDR